MKKVIVTCSALTAVCLLACGGEESVTTPVYPKADTPDGCIYHIERAFNGQDILVLKEHVAADFVFYFDAGDVGQVVNGYVIPESWTYGEFTRTLALMYKQAYRTQLYVEEIPAPPGVTTYVAEELYLSLTVLLDETHGYQVSYGRCDFAFEQYDDNGEKLWRLTEWRDHTVALSDAEPLSVGEIFARFH